MYTIAEEYVLPSGGKIYEKAFDPHVKLRAMTTMEEMRRSSPNNSQRVLADIIDSCLLTKLPIKSYDLALGDYQYLLYKLRVVTYGPDYKFTVGCPHCGQVYESSMNIDDLQVKEFDLETYNKSLEFTLPTSKKEIKLKTQTPRLLDEIDSKVKEFKKKNKVDYDPTKLITLQVMIDTVDGVKMDYVALENFIEKLTANDTNYILKRLEKSNSMIGVDPQVSVVCDKCGGEILTFFRYSKEFFEPSIDD